jgi:2-oxoglutarate ferredoxin oxidoreductase subunit beta
MALGLLYIRRLPVWQPNNRISATPEDLEEAFAL